MAALKTNDAYDDLFDYYGQIYNVDPALGKTVFHIESNGNPNAPNGTSGEIGGMQIMPKLAQHYGIDPRDMTQAIPAAMANLAEGLRASGGDPTGALRYYNGGPRALQNPQATNGYIAKALNWFPHIQIIGSANAAPPQGNGQSDVDKFRSEWGFGTGTASPSQSPDINAFRKEWGLTPTAAPSPPATTGTKPIIASDAAASAPDNLGDTAMTTAQMAASKAKSAQGGYASLEPTEPGFAHLLWSLGAPVGLGADVMSGARPVPIGAPNTEALTLAGTGAGMGDLRFANPLALNRPAIEAGPLASPPAIEPPPPAFAPTARTFEVDAQGNVTQAGLPATRAPAPAPTNPLATSSGTPLAAAPGRTAVAPLTPAERLIQSSMQSRPSASSGAPPGAPPGTPPLGTPGYTPTTPGVAPGAAGLSQAEAAAYASMRDAPPPAPLIPPQTKADAEALADRIIQYFHTGNPPTAPADLVVPPGYHPTLTGLTNDPGLATLHRGLESVSGTPAVIAQHNAQAINEAAARLQGQPGDANALAEQVNKVTTPLREAAFANKTNMDPGKVQSAIDTANEILAGPDSKRPGVVKYVKQVRDSMLDNAGKPETDPEQMYGAHKNINDILSPLSQSTDADKQAAAASVMKLKPLVQTAIESGANGFKSYMAKHAELMRPVDAQRLLESLNLTNASGDTRLAAVDSAIKAIAKQQQMPGARKADSVTKDQIGQLIALRNALRMEAARGTGKPISSNTFQNLATNSIVSSIAGNPLVGQVGGFFATGGLPGIALGHGISTAGKAIMSRSENLVRDALLERLLNFSGKGEASLAGKATDRAQAPGAPWNPLSSGPPP